MGSKKTKEFEALIVTGVEQTERLEKILKKKNLEIITFDTRLKAKENEIKVLKN